MRHEIQEQRADIHLHGLFDFGRAAYGTLEVELTGDYTGNVEVVIGEVARNGCIVHRPGFTTFLHRIFALRNGRHCYRFEIPRHLPAYSGFPHCEAPPEAGGEVAPFRYVEINRYHGVAVVRRTAWFGDWEDDAGHFVCDQPALNRVWEFCRYSLKATSLFDRYVDGERERMPYEGDAYITQLGHFCCNAHYRTARDTLEHFMTGPGRMTWLTEWLLLTPLLVRDYLLYSGDRESVERWLPGLDEKLLPNLLTDNGLLSPASFAEYSGTGFIRNQEGIVISGPLRDLIDWPETERDHYELGKINFVPNACLYLALLTMHELTGQESYRERAMKLRRAIRAVLLRNGRFVDSENSQHTALHTAMFALHTGLTEPDEIPVHRDLLFSRGMACSVFGAQFLLEACYCHRWGDHALKLMTDDGERSWLNMLREGSTITMESWGDRWKPNQDWNHPWGAAPANIVIRHLCGIRPLAPGFSRFIVDPQPAGLQWLECRQPTPHGPIELRLEGDILEWQAPAGTEAVYAGRILPGGPRKQVQKITRPSI